MVVNQDCRGCFGSEGDVNFLIPEAEDGADTVAWIRKQEWCDGTVGTFGTSWSGWTQTALAALGPEGLATMVANMSGADAHESSVRHGGALELRFLAWAFWHSAYNTQAALTAQPHVQAALNQGAPRFSDWLERMPIRPGQTQLALVPPYEKWALEILTRADYDDYWKHPSVDFRRHWDRVPDMPILLVGGWYDSYTRATFQNFVGLGAGGRRPVRVLMGPWTHGGKTMELSYAGDVEFGHDAALPSFDELHLRWYDRWLRGVDNGLDAEAPLRIFVMGGGSGRRSGAGRLVHGGRWRDEHEWPLARTRFTDFYLHGDGSLTTDPPREASSATTYRFDPARPVPSIGGNVSSLRDVLPLPAGLADPSYAGRGERTVDVMRPGGFDQREAPGFHGCRPPYLPLGSRPDVLVFQTTPLPRGGGGDRAHRGAPVGGHLRGGHRLHRQADRRLPAERVVPAGLCAEPDRQHRAAPLPQRPRAGGAGEAGRARAGDAHALSDEQPVHAGAPDPAGRVELELPAVRRESQHGGGDRAGAAAGGGGQHRVPRAGAGVAGGVAGRSDRALDR